MIPALGEAFVSTWITLAPWLLLGTVLAASMHFLLPPRLIRRQLSGPWGPLRAVLVGIPLPLCSCGVIPAALQLKKDGARDGAVLGFLIATPQTGVDSFFASASLLGWPFAAFKLVSALIMGVIGGYGLQRAGCPADEPVPSAQQSVPQASEFAPKLRRAWHFMGELIDSLALWLLLGVLISAALEAWVPNAFFAQLAQWGSGATIVVVLALSLPLYVCATASVPIAAALVGQGLPLGAALIFLMAGPATNVATMGAIYRSIGARALLWYLGTIIGGSVILAYFLDHGLGWLPSLGVSPLHEHQASLWEELCALLLALWVGASLLSRARRRWSSWRALHSTAPSQELLVGGLTCQGCVKKLDAALREVQGVQQVSVELASGAVKVTGATRKLQLQRAVERAGFELRSEPASCCAKGCT